MCVSQYVCKTVREPPRLQMVNQKINRISIVLIERLSFLSGYDYIYNCNLSRLWPTLSETRKLNLQRTEHNFLCVLPPLFLFHKE